MSITSRSTPTSGAAERTTASARPMASTPMAGASTRSAARSTASARSVTRSGSLGPTPTPTSRGPGATGGGAGRAAGAATTGVSFPDRTSRSMARRMSSASDRPVRSDSVASSAFRASGR